MGRGRRELVRRTGSVDLFIYISTSVFSKPARRLFEIIDGERPFFEKNNDTRRALRSPRRKQTRAPRGVAAENSSHEAILVRSDLYERTIEHEETIFPLRQSESSFWPEQHWRKQKFSEFEGSSWGCGWNGSEHYWRHRNWRQSNTSASSSIKSFDASLLFN